MYTAAAAVALNLYLTLMVCFLFPTTTNVHKSFAREQERRVERASFSTLTLVLTCLVCTCSFRRLSSLRRRMCTKFLLESKNGVWRERLSQHLRFVLTYLVCTCSFRRLSGAGCLLTIVRVGHAGSGGWTLL